MKNEKATLIYPVGLLITPEREMMGSEYAVTGSWWWLASANNFYHYCASERGVIATGDNGASCIHAPTGVRPSITLKPGIEVQGEGTYSSPYLVIVNNDII